VKEPVCHFLHDASLDFVMEGLERQVISAAYDVEGCLEVVCAMGKNEGAGVYEAEREVEGSWGEGR
jgi:hypothetical protein